MKRLLTLMLLLLFSVISVFAVCPAGMPRTTVFYVNGIWVSEDQATQTVLNTRGLTPNAIKPAFFEYMRGNPKLPYFDCVTFWLAYNTSEGLKDVLETFGLLAPEYTAYLSQSNTKLSTASDDVKIATVVSVEAYAEGLVSHLRDWLNQYGVPASRPKTQAEKDVEFLITEAVKSINNGEKVVIIGHSEGNLFANAAYDNLIQYQSKHFAGTNITLPNANRLEVIGVATPADHVAGNYGVSDNRRGKQRYTTHCLDFIRNVPNAMPYNVLGVGDVPLLDLEMCGTHEVLGFINSIQQTMLGLKYADKVAKVFLGQSPGVTVATAKASKVSLALSALKVANWVMSHTTHFMDAAYMNQGSSTRLQIMRDLEDSLPDPACNGDINCYLKDDFRSAVYTSNWVVTSNPSSSQSTVKTQSGIMTLDSYLTHAPNGDPGARLTVRSRRVFTGLFTASFSINHIGRIQSAVRLKKAVDNSTVLSLTINTPQNSVTVYPSSPAALPTASGFTDWHQISFVRKDTHVFLMVDGNSKSSAPTNVMDGYYLELDSQGDNILQVKDLLAARTAAVVSPIPGFALNMAQSKVSVKAGKDVDFAFSLTSNNGYSGKVTVEPFGLPVGVSATTVTVDVPANQTVNGKFTVSTSSSLKVGDYNFTVTATGSGFRSDPVMQTLTVTGLASVIAPPTNLSTVVK